MAAEISDITESNQVTDRELLEDIQARLIRLEDEIKALLGAWASGGLRGLRIAAGRKP